MIGKNKLQKALYLATYDKPGLNRRALSLKKSLEEAAKQLNDKETSSKKQKKKSFSHSKSSMDNPFFFRR